MSAKDNNIGYRIAYFVGYILIVILYAGMTWGIRGGSISNHINWLISIIMLFFYPLMYIVIKRQYTYFIEKKYDEMGYYKEKFTYEIKLRYADFSLKRIVIMVIAFYAVIILALYIIASWENAQIIYYKTAEIIFQNQLDIDISSLFLGIYSIALSLITLLNIFLDKSCLFFDGKDLSLIRWLRNLMIGSVFISIIAFALFYISHEDYNYKKLFGLFVLIWLGIMILLFVLYLVAFIGPLKTEKRFLNKIERYYSIKKNLRIPNKKWNKAKVVNVLIYLLDSYKAKSKNLDLYNVESIHFGSLFKNADSQVNKVSIKIIPFIIYIVCILCIYMQTAFAGLDKGVKWSWFAIIVLGVVIELMIHILRKGDVSYGAFVCSIAFDSWWGYFLKLRDNKNSIYVTSGDLLQIHDYLPVLGKRKYHQYLLSLKRLICFWNLACDMSYEDLIDFKEFGIECLCAFASDVKARGESVEHIILPIIICTCLRENISDNDNIRRMFQGVVVDKNLVIVLKSICLEMLRDIHGDDMTFDKMDYPQRMEELFSFIS